MKELIKWIITQIARVHDRISSINDSHNIGLTDKQLHFFVFFFVTAAVFFAVQIVFKWLSKRSISAMSWIYTGSAIVAVVFAVEAGQGLTNTGQMELWDAAYGIWGMIVCLGMYILWRLVKFVFGCFKPEDKNSNRRQNDDRRYRMR